MAFTLPAAYLTRANSKGYIAGFGTSTVLLASIALLVSIMGATTAFRDWSSAGGPPGARDIVLRDLSPSSVASGDAAVPGTAARRGGRTRRAASSVPSSVPGAAALQRTRGRRQRIGGVRPRRNAELPASRGPSKTIDAPTAVPAPAAPVPPAPGRQPARVPPPLAAGDPLTTGPTPRGITLGDRLGNTTQALTDAVGNTVRPVSPVLGDTVNGVGKTVSGLLRGRPTA